MICTGVTKMKIISIEIKNYRSIKEAKITNLNDFNIFVGQNNHGKTNIFEAIEWFFSGTRKNEQLDSLRYNLDKNNVIEVVLELDGLQEGLTRMKNSKNASTLKKISGDSIKIRRTSNNEAKKREVFNNESKSWEDSGTGFDKALDDLLPRFEYIDTHKSFEEVSAYKKTSPIGILLSAFLANIIETDAKYIQFQNLFNEVFNEDAEHSGIRKEIQNLGIQIKENLVRQFPDTQEVNANIGMPAIEDLFKSFNIEVNDGVTTRVCDKGDGMQRAVMLAIMELYANYRKGQSGNGKNNLFFIDEAELHLHPSAQRRLKEVLLEIAKNQDQVFINTHSSVLIADDEEHQTIYQVFKEQKETKIRPVEPIEKPNVIFELLGGSPADLLLPFNFLIVEGRSETIFLNLVIRRFYSTEIPLQMVESKGDITKGGHTFFAISEMFKPLSKSIYRKRAVLVFDKCKQNALDSFLKDYSLELNQQVFCLPVGSIEEYYPSPWKRNPQGMSGEEKLKLAKEVGEKISQQEFETEMKIFFDALTSCWQKAFPREG